MATAMTRESASLTKKKYAQFPPRTLTAISNQAADLLMNNGQGKLWKVTFKICLTYCVGRFIISAWSDYDTEL
jgi:hypothetical protein